MNKIITCGLSVISKFRLTPKMPFRIAADDILKFSLFFFFFFFFFFFEKKKKRLAALQTT